MGTGGEVPLSGAGSVLNPAGCGWTCCWNCTGEPWRGVVCCEEEIEVADWPDEIDGAADGDVMVRFRSMMRGSFSWACRKKTVTVSYLFVMEVVTKPFP